MKIEIKNLLKAYNKDFNILNDITAEFNFDGKMIVIAGHEGSGKTTLLNVIAGLDNDYSGQVLLDGEDRKVIDNKSAKISYIMDPPVLFERKNVFDNLAYVFKVEKGKYNKKEDYLKIKEVCDLFGLSGIVQKKIKKCSSFEKLVVCFARSYLKNSKLIIIDEPLKDLISIEKSYLLNYINFLISKLSCGVILADNGQNLACFEGCDIFEMDYGVLKEMKRE